MTIMLCFLMSKKEQILREIFEYHTRSIIDEHDLKFKMFWQKSYNHFNIIMLLSSVSEEEDGVSYEKICDLYPHKLASRTTILSILNEGHVNNFFLKHKSTKDNRMRNYKLMSDRKRDVLAWLDNHPITRYNK